MPEVIVVNKKFDKFSSDKGVSVDPSIPPSIYPQNKEVEPLKKQLIGLVKNSTFPFRSCMKVNLIGKI